MTRPPPCMSCTCMAAKRRRNPRAQAASGRSPTPPAPGRRSTARFASPQGPRPRQPARSRACRLGGATCVSASSTRACGGTPRAAPTRTSRSCWGMRVAAHGRAGLHLRHGERPSPQPARACGPLRRPDGPSATMDPCSHRGTRLFLPKARADVTCVAHAVTAGPRRSRVADEDVTPASPREHVPLPGARKPHVKGCLVSDLVLITHPATGATDEEGPVRSGSRHGSPPTPLALVGRSTPCHRCSRAPGPQSGASIVPNPRTDDNTGPRTAMHLSLAYGCAVHKAPGAELTRAGTARASRGPWSLGEVSRQPTTDT